MARIVYLGDEATGAGLRLAGVDARYATSADVATQLQDVIATRPDCVLLDGTLAEYVPASQLAAACDADAPLFAVIPDVRGRGSPPDLARLVRDALGIEA